MKMYENAETLRPPNDSKLGHNQTQPPCEDLQLGRLLPTGRLALETHREGRTEGCIGPEEVHGFGGLLSMIGTDILLALLINVATGELCKAFAFHIAKPLGGAISCGARPSSRITRPYIHACRHTNTSYTLFGFILQSIYI